MKLFVEIVRDLVFCSEFISGLFGLTVLMWLLAWDRQETTAENACLLANVGISVAFQDSRPIIPIAVSLRSCSRIMLAICYTWLANHALR